jgi:hypothetical protein
MAKTKKAFLLKEKILKLHEGGAGYKSIASKFQLKRDQDRGLILDNYEWKGYLKPLEKRKITLLRKKGPGYKKIAREMKMSRTNVRDYILGRNHRRKVKKNK